MSSFFRSVLLAIAALALALVANGQQTLGINMQWDPVADSDLEANTPLLDKDAGVEALFWRVHVVDERQGDEIQRALWHYVRLKVFNEKGKEKVSTLDIPFDERSSILYVSARTIKPDGSIVEMKKDAVHDRDLLRSGGLKRRVKSFAAPGVEPGAIVEYRWKELRHKYSLYYLRVQFQREYPIRKVTYFVKPLSLAYEAGYQMAAWPFNCQPSPLKLENSGFQSTSLENVTAFKDEPLMPAEPNVRPWMLIFYHNKPKRDPENYWTDVGKEKYRQLKQAIKVSNEIKQATDTTIQGATSEEDKVLAIIRYVRKNLRNLNDSSVTEAERTRWVKTHPKDRMRNSAEVLELGFGSADELNTLFAAMAQHAVLEARPILVADRSDVLFSPQMADDYFLDNIDMAVKQGEQWKLYDVSTKLLSPKMLSWQEEGSSALLSDPKKSSFIQSPLSPPEASETTRVGRLKLDPDGTLSGTIEERYTGHLAHEQRLRLAGESEAKNVESVKDRVTSVFARAEVSDTKLLNVDDPEKPLVIQYSLNIPAYAQRTGKRLLFQPLYFQRFDTALFESADRKFDVHFRYAWKESDDVTIDLPTDFKLDNAESPGSLSFGPPGSYSIEFGVREGKTLSCKRTLIFGAGGYIAFPKTAYPNLKRVFDEIHRRDSQGLSLKQAS